MTERIDLDARLARFLAEEAPRDVPERLVAATRDALAGTPQRGFGPGLGGRLSRFVPTPVGAVAAVLAVVVLGSILTLSNRVGPGVGSSPSPVGPASSSPPPSPSPSPSPSACPTNTDPCVSALEPGEHSSTSFDPTIRYTVPTGWINTLDVKGQFDLRWAAGGQYTYPDGLTFHDAISIFRRPVAESPTSQSALDGVGSKAKDLAQWLRGHADLVASATTPATLGGATGYRLTLSLPNGPRASPDHCTRDHGESRCESLFLSSDQAATYGFGLVGPEVAVVYLLDVPTGDTVMVVIDDVDGIDQPALEAAARPVIESLSFSP